MSVWAEKIFWPLVEPQDKVMLIADSFSVHIKMLRDICIRNPEYRFVNFIPQHCTPFLQPLDIGVNHIFKNEMRKLWVTGAAIGEEIDKEVVKN